MTTHVSRERRDAVAVALSLPTYSMTYDESLFLADAAIQTMLPDRDQFMGLLDDLVCSATEYGNATPNSEREARAAYEASEARAALIALVYGIDEEPSPEGVAYYTIARDTQEGAEQ